MKRILVLGATSGIGRALVVLLRQEGYEVIAAGRRRSLLESLGGEILELDVTAEDAVERAATVGADTVIFNAGYGERTPMPDGVRTDRALAVNIQLSNVLRAGRSPHVSVLWVRQASQGFAVLRTPMVTPPLRRT
ncbi:MAG: SDR family NAD(P)-dependent oxidoreductase [Kiritimatiellae bacterium]|nr:SDR family NAD(P)-dependent oxidoreductase [Kiritimatiellia bacterium]